MPYKDKDDPRAIACQKKASKKYYYNNRKSEIARSRRWNENNRARFNANQVLRRSVKLQPNVVLYNNAKNRAKKYSLPFDLVPSDIIVPEFCPVLGIPLKVATGCAKPNSPSIDKIIPEKGYVKGNIAVVSHKANTMKSDASIDEIRLLLAFMERSIATERGSPK